jgi:hypothetical protein
LALTAAVPWLRLRRLLRPIASASAIIGLAAASQIALNAYLYRQPSLNGDAPPYLMARIIADGPGRWYLQQHCSEEKLALCKYQQNLTGDGDDFLWGEKGGWAVASEEDRDRMAKEESHFVWASVRAFPRAELRIALSHFWEQLCAFGIYVFDANQWMGSHIEDALPGQSARYQRSLEAHNALPLDFFSDIYFWVVVASLVALPILAALLRRQFWPQLAGLSFIVIVSVFANAFITGVFSNAEDRYQSRVVWLIPFLACILALAWLDQRRSSRTPVRSATPDGR